MLYTPNARLFQRMTWVVLILFFYSFVPRNIWATHPSAPDQHPTILALDVYSTSLSPSQIRSLSKSFRQELIQTRRFLVYSRSDIQKMLTKNSGEHGMADEIDQYVSKAKKLYDDFKFESAAILMQEAMKTILTFEATPNILPKMSNAFLTQAVILDTLNRSQEAKISFMNAAALHPTLQLEPALYAPGVIAKLNEAKENYPKIKEGSLQIESTPPGAEVFVGGKKIGTTPLPLKNFPLGVQEIKLTKEGSRPWKKKIAIVANSSKTDTNRIEVALNQGGINSFVDAVIGEIVTHKTLEAQLNKIARAGRLLSTDLVFAARIEKVEVPLNQYDLFMVKVDSTTGAVMKGYQRIGPKLANADQAISSVLKEMSARKSPAKFTDLIAVESENQKKPFYKRWYFYTLLGVAVAGGAGATVLLTRGGSNGSAGSPFTSGVVGAPGRQP